MEAKHFVVELFNADFSKLNSEIFIKEMLVESSNIANSTLLNVYTHKFDPQGVTGFALLAESHISIHTWPELKFASVDAFTCGSHTSPEDACVFIAKELGAKSHYLASIERFNPQTLIE